MNRILLGATDSCHLGPPRSFCMAGHGVYLFALPGSLHAPPIGLYGNILIRNDSFF